MITLQKQIAWVGRVQASIAVVTLIGLILFYAFIYLPGKQRLSELGTASATAELQISKNKDAARDLDAIKRDVQRLKDQIARSRRLPKDQDLSGFLHEITGLAQTAKVQKFRYEPNQTRALELCSELPITLNFSGPFMEVATLLRQAEEMPRMMRTRRLSLKCSDGKTGIVDAEISMSIFFAVSQ